MSIDTKNKALLSSLALGMVLAGPLALAGCATTYDNDTSATSAQKATGEAEAKGEAEAEAEGTSYGSGYGEYKFIFSYLISGLMGDFFSFMYGIMSMVSNSVNQ